MLSVSVDEPPGPITTEEDLAGPVGPADPDDEVEPAWAGSQPSSGPPPTWTPAPGPPGGRIFSLEGRPAPALYLLAWLLTVGGFVGLFISSQAAPSLGRSIFVVGAMASVLLGLASGAGYQVVARRDRDLQWYRGPSPVLLFGVVLGLTTLLSAVLGAFGLLNADAPGGFLLGLLVVAGCYAVAVWLFVVRTDVLSWAQMGWPTEGTDRLRRSLQGIGWGALVMIPTTIVMLMVAGIVAMVLGVQAPDVVPSASTSAEALAVALAAALVAPIGEELFFRGFALTAWARDLPERSALIRSAVFFAVIHIANISATSFSEGARQAVLQVVVIGPVGFVLGWVFLRRGIMASIA
ncbi:MAG: type II CAAX endopeptidase family protein, partial [Chloroflexota bacterium]